MADNPQAFRSSVESNVRHVVESNVRHVGWAIALRGVLAVIFGVIALRSPSAAARALVIVFGIYALADGAFDLFLASQLGRAGQRWGWQLFAGIATIAIGVIALAYPGVTLLALVLLVGIRAITLGILELVGAFSWQWVDSRWLLGITGVLSIILGILLLGSPATGGLALLWTIGVYAIIYGVMVFAFSLRMLRVERHEAELHRPAATPS